METAYFQTSNVLSVISDTVLFRNDTGILKLLCFMTDDLVTNNQMPRVVGECAPCLANQFPELAQVDTSIVTEDNFDKWLAGIEEIYGKTMLVQKLPLGVHEIKNPIVEFKQQIEGKV